jgi:hypothetical protein
MKNAVFWDVTPCSACKNRHLGGTYRLHHEGDKSRRPRNIVSSSWQSKYAVKNTVFWDVMPCGSYKNLRF